MRHVVRFFMYFYYETSYTMGENGTVKLGKKVAVANTLFNVSSGSIVVGDYTIFGKVIRGLEVADKIAQVETDDADWPLQNVYIRRVEIID